MFQLVIRNEIIHDDETKACENCRKREEELLVEFASDDEDRQAEWLEEKRFESGRIKYSSIQINK